MSTTTDINRTFGYVYVFDYIIGNIYEIELNSVTEYLEYDELLSYYGLSKNSCYTMYSATKKEIERIEPV